MWFSSRDFTTGWTCLGSERALFSEVTFVCFDGSAAYDVLIKVIVKPTIVNGDLLMKQSRHRVLAGVRAFIGVQSGKIFAACRDQSPWLTAQAYPNGTIARLRVIFG